MQATQYRPAVVVLLQPTSSIQNHRFLIHLLHVPYKLVVHRRAHRRASVVIIVEGCCGLRMQLTKKANPSWRHLIVPYQWVPLQLSFLKGIDRERPTAE